MIKPQATPSAYVWIFGAFTMTLVVSYTCVIAVFYIKGLHHYSYGEIAAQTPNVGNLVSSDSPHLVMFSLRFLACALLVAELGRYVLPLAMFGLSGMLIRRWLSLR